MWMLRGGDMLEINLSWNYQEIFFLSVMVLFVCVAIYFFKIKTQFILFKIKTRQVGRLSLLGKQSQLHL